MRNTKNEFIQMPILKSLIFILTVGWSFQASSQSNASATSLKNGQSVYISYCQSCHMEDGNGLPGVFPPLVKTGNLNDPNRLVKVILQGMRGPIVVKGDTYDGEMAPTDLTDQEVADVINYIRNTWGNKAPYLNAADIAKAKKSTVKGFQPY
jgi:mono/diheme cytochrome c family protein